MFLNVIFPFLFNMPSSSSASIFKGKEKNVIDYKTVIA